MPTTFHHINFTTLSSLYCTLAFMLLPALTSAFVPSVPSTDVVPPVVTAPQSDAYKGLTLTWERDAERSIREMLLQRRTAKDTATAGPLMISISGIPGSGKSTCAEVLANFLEDTGCLVFPHDGYHYPLSTLRTFPDADAAVYRRGAPDTFHANKLLSDLNRIRHGEEAAVTLPGFDHAVGDPVYDEHTFERQKHQIVICEGLYLLHDQDGWEDMATCFDLNIFVDANVDKCMERVKIRNKCIPGYTPEEIDIRVDAVDRKNAVTVNASKKRADFVFRSAAF